MPLVRTRGRRGPGLIIGLLTAIVAVVPAVPPAGAARLVGALPSADSTVAEADPDANDGTGTTLGVDESPVLESFLTFDVADPGEPITRATLRLFVVNPSADAPKVHRSDSGWSETGVTWNTRPARHELLADLGPVSTGQFVEYDVTSAVTGAGAVSFDLVDRRHPLQRPGSLHRPAGTDRADRAGPAPSSASAPRGR